MPELRNSFASSRARRALDDARYVDELWSMELDFGGKVGHDLVRGAARSTSEAKRTTWTRKPAPLGRRLT
jgi:hypothetical protein